jgi:hypothetical protein
MHDRPKPTPSEQGVHAKDVRESGLVPRTSGEKDEDGGARQLPGTINWLQWPWSSGTRQRPEAKAPKSASSSREPSPSPGRSDVRRSARQPVGYLGTLATAAETAFAEKRPEDAKRLLNGPLETLLHAAHNGAATDAADVELAAVLAARLAIATRDGSWLEYPFLLFGALRRTLPNHAIDEIQSALQQVPATGTTAIKLYLGVLELRSRATDSAERCLLRRIQQCCQLAEAR